MQFFTCPARCPASRCGRLPFRVAGARPVSGRPRVYDEDMETVSFRLPRSRIFAIGAVAESRGESRSEFIREAIDAALLACG